MNTREVIAATALTAGLLAVGCSSPEQSVTPPTSTPVTSPAPEAGKAHTDDPRAYDSRSRNYTLGYCDSDPHGWANYIDSNPNDVEERPTTVALAEINPNQPDTPTIRVGAVVRGIGGIAYELTFTDNQPSKQINLKDGPFSQILFGTKAYDGVFSAELSGDGKAYFTINCLPAFGFNGNHPTTPLKDVPTIPQPTTTTASAINA